MRNSSPCAPGSDVASFFLPKISFEAFRHDEWVRTEPIPVVRKAENFVPRFSPKNTATLGSVPVRHDFLTATPLSMNGKQLCLSFRRNTLADFFLFA